jgi:hypothetical protein
MKLKFLGVLMLCTFLLTLGSTAEASNRSWVIGASGNWVTPGVWNTTPVPADTATFTSGTATIDATSGVISVIGMGGSKVAQTGGPMVVNINSGANITVASTGIPMSNTVAWARSSGVTTTVNQSGGYFRVYSTLGYNDGEVRLINGSTAVPSTTVIYNLSNGTLDTEILSRGAATATANQFNATGGTLVIRNRITKFGTVTDVNGLAQPGQGFNQGTSKLEIGNIGSVITMYVGGDANSSIPIGSRTDYAVGAGGEINIDIASASSFDKMRVYGDLINTAGATLSIDLLGGYNPTAGETFDVLSFLDPTARVSLDLNIKYMQGSGAVSLVAPAGWSTAWVDTNADTYTDTLRVTAIPEPATIALISLGLLAIRRKK